MKFTIVVPCFNEEQRLDPEPWCKFVQGRQDVDFLFVDDGSSDGTYDVLLRIVEQCPQGIRAMKLPRNGGKAEAVRQGILAAVDAGAEGVGFWDADLATPLDAIPLLIAPFVRAEVGVAMGSRVRLLGRHVEREAARHWFGRATALAASLVLGVHVYDTQCGAKLLRPGRHVVALFGAPFSSRWAFDVELLARWIGAVGGPEAARETLVEVPLPKWSDVAGSKLRPRDFAITPLELAKIAWRYRSAAGTGVAARRSAKER